MTYKMRIFMPCTSKPVAAAEVSTSQVIADLFKSQCKIERLHRKKHPDRTGGMIQTKISQTASHYLETSVVIRGLVMNAFWRRKIFRNRNRNSPKGREPRGTQE